MLLTIHVKSKGRILHQANRARQQHRDLRPVIPRRRQRDQVRQAAHPMKLPELALQCLELGAVHVTLVLQLMPRQHDARASRLHVHEIQHRGAQRDQEGRFGHGQDAGGDELEEGGSGEELEVLGEEDCLEFAKGT